MKTFFIKKGEFTQEQVDFYENNSNAVMQCILHIKLHRFHKKSIFIFNI